MSEGDRERWDARYAAQVPTFAAHPILRDAGLPFAARVLELASGPSGTALALAAGGAQVTCVDVAGVGLAQLEAEARRRGLTVRMVCADLSGVAKTPRSPSPEAEGDWVGADWARAEYDLVMATRYWDAEVFAWALGRVAVGGRIVWEGFTEAEREVRPGFAFGMGDGDPRLPEGWIEEVREDVGRMRRLVARRIG